MGAYLSGIERFFIIYFSLSFWLTEVKVEESKFGFISVILFLLNFWLFFRQGIIWVDIFFLLFSIFLFSLWSFEFALNVLFAEDWVSAILWSSFWASVLFEELYWLRNWLAWVGPSDGVYWIFSYCEFRFSY